MTQPVPLVVLAIAVPLLNIAVSIPLIRGRVKPNPLYGVRTGKTLASAEIWYKANRLMGIYLTVGTVLTLVWWAVLAFFSLGPQRLAIYLSLLGFSVLTACGVTLLKVNRM